MAFISDTSPERINPKDPAGETAQRSGINRLDALLTLCLLDAMGPVLVILSYLGLNLTPLINVFFLLITFCTGLMIRSIKREHGTVLVGLLIFLSISIAKMLLLTSSVEFNEDIESILKYFLSIIMPAICFGAVFSLKEDNPLIVEQTLVVFAKRYLYIVIPVVVVYAVFNISGTITYFGLGINFHYVTPYFVKGFSSATGFILLIFLTGKRAVLLNFLIQTALFMSGRLRRAPLLVFIGFCMVAAASFVFQENLQVPLRRFILMAEVIGNIDWSEGLFSLAQTYDAIVLFGGRLEEVVAISQYFQEHPNHIWLGAPPGANFTWFVDQSDYIELKSYAHVTWVGYFFRYGLIFTVCLMAYFFALFVRCAHTRSPLWLVFVGILSSSMFGANLFVSPTTWIMIALTARYGHALALQYRANSK